MHAPAVVAVVPENRDATHCTADDSWHHRHHRNGDAVRSPDAHDTMIVAVVAAVAARPQAGIDSLVPLLECHSNRIWSSDSTISSA